MTKGSCMCSAVEYEYTGEPMVTALCHCTDCQKWSGGAYTSNVVVPRKDFKVIKGSPKSYKIKGDSGKINDHWFCGDCGSSLYTELEVMPDAVCIKAGGIDDKAVRDFKKTAVEFYCKDRMAYSKAVEGAEQKPVFG
ncbi:hypothetical protein HO133_000193 [Letharia lupina]|uniref:CENP-V/GFA domain-containing protein n=1 Tax=Letharia lupina TaxID=560253 RepID=A0A8H6CHL1_9LECA|nr:uncharacterized protein HO133_000193 [Letharia lupina]KAF6223351.1 hypothetical protein HO133_000193 [Letharia lupina]